MMKWTEEMTEFILMNAGHMTDSELTAHIIRATGVSITQETVTKRRQRLGIAKAAGRGVCKVTKRRTN